MVKCGFKRPPFALIDGVGQDGQSRNAAQLCKNICTVSGTAVIYDNDRIGAEFMQRFGQTDNFPVRIQRRNYNGNALLCSALLCT